MRPTQYIEFEVISQRPVLSQPFTFRDDYEEWQQHMYHQITRILRHSTLNDMLMNDFDALETHFDRQFNALHQEVRRILGNW